MIGIVLETRAGLRQTRRLWLKKSAARRRVNETGTVEEEEEEGDVMRDGLEVRLESSKSSECQTTRMVINRHLQRPPGGIVYLGWQAERMVRLL